jgi:hypothetical protein
VALQDLPLALVGLSRLVQQGLGNAELADVVQESRPAKPVLIRLTQLELVGDQIG